MSRGGGAFAVVAVLLLAACGRTTAPPEVRVNAGDQTVSIKPTQYCLDGTLQRYRVQPPVIEVAPDMTISLTVPDVVARHGWSLQVWDEKLARQIGNVDVAEGKAVAQVNASDAVPPTYYLVVVERPREECHSVSGGWPVGFIRSGATPPSGSAPPSAMP